MSCKSKGGTKRPLTGEEEAEQEDKKLLAENTAKLDLVMQLLLAGENRDSANRKAEEARGKVGMDSREGMEETGGGRVRGEKTERIFHSYRGKRVPIRRGAANYLELANALEAQIKTREVGGDLLDALDRLAQNRIEILERQLKRLS